MRAKRNFFAVFFVIPFITFSQVNTTQWLAKKFKDADSVLLISHVLTAGSTDLVVDNTGKEVSPKFMVEGKLNRQSLTEEKIIKGNDPSWREVVVTVIVGLAPSWREVAVTVIVGLAQASACAMN